MDLEHRLFYPEVVECPPLNSTSPILSCIPTFYITLIELNCASGKNVYPIYIMRSLEDSELYAYGSVTDGYNNLRWWKVKKDVLYETPVNTLAEKCFILDSPTCNYALCLIFQNVDCIPEFTVFYQSIHPQLATPIEVTPEDLRTSYPIQAINVEPYHNSIFSVLLRIFRWNEMEIYNLLEWI